MDEQQPKRKVKINLEDLVYHFDASRDANQYLDLETGEVVMVTHDTHIQLEQIVEDYWVEPGQVDWKAVADELNLQDWEMEMLQEAEKIGKDWQERYLPIPTLDSSESYRDMEEFVYSIQDKRLANRLTRAISGQGAFRNFREVLSGYPSVREAWFAYKEERMLRRALDWLAAEGIEPLITDEPNPDPE